MKTLKFSFLALFFVLFGINSFASGITQESLYRIIKAESVYYGTYDKKPYAAYIEGINGLTVTGYYINAAAAVADTIPFNMRFGDNYIVFTQRGQSQKIRLSGTKLQGTHISGKAGKIFKRRSFDFDVVEQPYYKEYDSRRYHEPMFGVETKKNITYAKAEGYWAEATDDSEKYGELIFNLSKTLNLRNLNLKMDIYLPKNDTLSRRPLIMFIHGGAFYFGSKNDLSIVEWCKHYAELGYVTASINYRVGFQPSLSGIERAGYRAVQDAHAAMRYLVANQETYRIDTSMIFVGGSSAGAITSLNLGYMTEETRPSTTYKKGSSRDLGPIETSGNELKNTFTLKGIVDMWGAVSTLDVLKSNNIPIIAFHGNADKIVPYDYNYPFTGAKSLKKVLFNKMYGSSCIVEEAPKYNIWARLHTFDGWDHSPHVNKDGSLNENFYFIQNKMDEFFADIITPEKVEITNEQNTYSLSVNNCENVRWQADGGMIIHCSGNRVSVVWFANSPQHLLKASGTLPHGAAFTCSYKPEF